MLFVPLQTSAKGPSFLYERVSKLSTYKETSLYITYFKEKKRKAIKFTYEAVKLLKN